MEHTIRATAFANLDVPGPRVLQLLDEIGRLREREVAALALIDDLLHRWNTGHKVHPGYEGINPGNEHVERVDEWNRRRAALDVRSATADLS